MLLRGIFTRSGRGPQVVEWVKPPIMDIPTLFYKDLQAAGLKNDSTMTVGGVSRDREKL